MGLFTFLSKALLNDAETVKCDSQTERTIKFEREFRPVFNRYYAGVQKLKSDWSVMYNLKDYGGTRAVRFEAECRSNINAYKEMVSIEEKYGKDHITMVEGYKRLAMLYERQGEFEKSAAICREAIAFGDFEDMKVRLARAIKKAGRAPSAYETELLGDI